MPIVNEWCNEVLNITHFTSEHLKSLPHGLLKEYALPRIGIIAIRYALHILILGEQRVCARKKVSATGIRTGNLGEHRPS